MKGNGSASQRRGQGQHPKTLGFPVYQRAHILGFLGMRALDLGRVPNHKVRFPVEKQFEVSRGSF